MADVLFVLITLAFFALAAGLVKVCDAFIDTAPEDGEPDVVETGAAETVASPKAVRT